MIEINGMINVSKDPDKYEVSSLWQLYRLLTEKVV